MTNSRRRKGLALAAVVAALVASAPLAARADVIARGYVVRLEAGEMYFDIGRAAGLMPGRPVRVKRPIQLRHPVTGKMVTDELPLGGVTVSVVGESLSMAIPEGELAAAVQVGDVVEALIPREEPVAAPPPKPKKPPRPRPAPPPQEPLPSVDADTERVLAVWRQTGGQSLEVRIAAWEAFLAQYPESPYAPAIVEELDTLRAYQEKFAVQSAEARISEPMVGGVDHAPPTKWHYHMALGLAFVLRDPARVRGAWVHYRRAGGDTFRKAELKRDGDGYLRGVIDGPEVEDPGIEYFVEVVTGTGMVGSAVGTPVDPIRIDVTAPKSSQIFVERRNRSRISLSSSYLQFSTLDDCERAGAQRPERECQDYLFIFEADFFYRLRTRLYGIRLGMGVLNGRGGESEPVMDPARAGFNYGYTELEFHLAGQIAFMPRLIAGIGRDGLGFGGEARLRFGAEDGANITFGVSTLAEVGTMSEIRMQWTAFPKVPLGLGIAIGDQPNQGDLGVRFSADIGVRALDWVQPTLQVSYQGRTVEHSGFGAGFGLVFDW